MSRRSLALRNLLFTIVVPGAGGAYVPWLILTWARSAAGYRGRRAADVASG